MFITILSDRVLESPYSPDKIIDTYSSTQLSLQHIGHTFIEAGEIWDIGASFFASMRVIHALLSSKRQRETLNFRQTRQPSGVWKAYTTFVTTCDYSVVDGGYVGGPNSHRPARSGRSKFSGRGPFLAEV